MNFQTNIKKKIGLDIKIFAGYQYVSIFFKQKKKSECIKCRGYEVKVAYNSALPFWKFVGVSLIFL